jgi:hypothetical protein
MCKLSKGPPPLKRVLQVESLVHMIEITDAEKSADERDWKRQNHGSRVRAVMPPARSGEVRQWILT